MGLGVALAVDVAGRAVCNHQHIISYEDIEKMEPPTDTGVVATLVAYAAWIVPPPYSATGPDLASK